MPYLSTIALQSDWCAKSNQNIYIISVEKKCYVLDLAQSTKTWEDFTELPEGSAYHALVYNEKVNRLYSIAGERTRYDTGSGPTWVSIHF